MKTLETEFQEVLKNDPRWRKLPEPLVRGLFVLGAQATLTIVQEHSPEKPTLSGVVSGLRAVNEEIGALLKAVQRDPKARP